MKRVLIICLGNICRSPMAEAIFRDMLAEKGLQDIWTVDSAALVGFHTGEAPDRRTIETLTFRGIKVDSYNHTARPIKNSDFFNYDWIFGMDQENMKQLHAMKPEASKAQVELLGKYDPYGETIIKDPYYDHDYDGFDLVFEQCERCIRAFLEAQGL